MPRPRLERIQASRIAILKPSALGDVVHATPLLGALRVRFPDAHISWVVNRTYAPLIEGNPNLDEVIAIDRRPFKAGLVTGWSQTYGVIEKLRRARFDLVLDLQGLFRTGLMAAFTGAPRKVGFASAREGSTLFYTDHIPGEFRSRHAVDQCWRFAEALGAGDVPKRFHVPIQPVAQDWAKEQLRKLPRPWIAVAPGSRWRTKQWPAEHFAELVRRAVARFGGSLILLGGGEDVPTSEAVRTRFDGPSLALTGRTDLAQLAAVLSLADVTLANDSGPLHVAVALGRAAVAPYTCTRVDLHGPFDRFDQAVATTVACQGSYLKNCSHLSCMSELTPDRLWPTLETTLSRWQSMTSNAGRLLNSRSA